MTVLSYAAVFAGLGLASTAGNYASAGALVSGVFVGSTLWWLILSSGIGAFRERFDAHRLRRVNVVSGAIITAFGLSAILSTLA